MEQKDQHQLAELQRRIASEEASEADRILYTRWLTQINFPNHEFPDREIEAKRQAFQQHFDLAYTQTKNHTLKLYRWLSAAAAILILSTAGWFFANHAKPVTQYTTVFTRNGERKVVTLADGSTVTLNNASSVRFPKVFPDDIREVSLGGEAFFDVVHQSQQPFIVKAGALKVQVLGTSFDVRAYPGDAALAVTVATGKVGIMTNTTPKSWLLTPGRQLTYRLADSTAEVTNVHTTDYTSWQKGELIFKDEQLQTICKKLERWYGVRLTIKTEALKKKRLSLKMHNESLPVVMRALSAVGGFQYQIKDQTVKIW